MANVLLDFLRQAAMGAGADKVREYADPLIRGAIDEFNRPDQPMTEGYRYDEQGYPTYSTGYEAVTTPYAPSGIAGVEGATLSDEQLMNVLNETAADQNRQQVQDFVRQNTVSEPAGFEPINIEDITTPEDLMQKIDPERMKAQGITPQEGYRMAEAAAHLNLVPEYTRVAEETGNDSILDSVGNFFSELFGDEQKMLALAVGFNNLTYRPNEAFNKYAYERIGELRDEPKRNATIAALRKKGMGSIADYIEQTKDVKGGMKMALEQGQYVTGSGADIAKQFGITGLNPKKPYRYNKMTGKVEGIGGGDTIFEATKPSKGYEFVRDESGKILYEQPIPKKITPERAGTKIQSAELVLDDMNRLTNLIEESPKLTTGFGTMLSGVPTTSARDAQALAGTIKANIGFDRLQRMREESPTGGALGQVAVQELQALQSTLGSLDLGQSTDQVLYNINRLKKQYAKTMLALAESQPNFNEYFPEFDRAAYEKIFSEKDSQESSVKPQITPEQAAAELARRRGK